MTANITNIDRYLSYINMGFKSNSATVYENSNGFIVRHWIINNAKHSKHMQNIPQTSIFAVNLFENDVEKYFSSYIKAQMFIDN